MKTIIAIFIALSVSVFAATDSELDRAYAKEFAYLKAQKSMLEKRLKDVKAEQNKKLSSAKRELGTLQNVVLMKTAQSERLSDELFRSQQNATVMSDDTALIEAVMMQSTTALKPYNIDINVDPKNYQAALKEVFEKANSLITTLSSIRVTEGKFYATDGSEKSGKLVHIGNIATYGVANDISAALVPAGANKLKVWKAPEAAQTANALAKGEKVNTLHIFVYENLSKEVDDLREKTVIDVIDSGGVIGWVIVVLGLIGLILAMFRAFFLLSANSSGENLASAALDKLLNGGVENALTFLKSKKGSTARLLKATIRNLDRDREHIEDIVAESILHESSRLDKFGSAILVIAAVAPLLGLLGTVTGMIATFDIITEFGTGDPKLLSGGISIALVTTELGLIVAIPILMLGNLLSGWAEKVKDNMEHSALHLINEYNKQH